MLVVSLVAFENSPAARACSLMATVVSEVCVAIRGRSGMIMRLCVPSQISQLRLVNG